MRILICYDWLDSAGGAERVLHELLQCFPQAKIATQCYTHNCSLKLTDQLAWISPLARFQAVGRLRFVQSLVGAYFWRRCAANEYDLVISVTSDQATAVRHVRHICICLTPPRHLWEFFHWYIYDTAHNWVVRLILAICATPLRVLNVESARRCLKMVAISQEVALRIKRTYGMASEIVYPLVERL